MALPACVRVKISSEQGGSVSLTPVVVRDLPLRELVAMLLPVTGKDVARIQEILRRGSLVQSASRFRWQGWEVEADDLARLLNEFPDPAPERPFDASRCVRVVLHLGPRRVEILRRHASRKRLWRRQSFWEVLFEVASLSPPTYKEYDYHSGGDRYWSALTEPAARHLMRNVPLLRDRALRHALSLMLAQGIDFFVEREAP